MKSKIIVGGGLAGAALLAWLHYSNKPKTPVEVTAPSPTEQSKSAEQPKKEEAAVTPKAEDQKEVDSTPKEDAVKQTATPKTEETSGKADVVDPDSKVIVAKLSDGQEITLKRLKEAFSSLPAEVQQATLEKIYPNLIDRLVDQAVIMDAASKAGIDKSPEVLKQFDDTKQAIIQKAYLDSELAKLIDDAILKAKYDELLKMLPKDTMEVKLSHILVKTIEEANEIIKQLKGSDNFEKLVQEKSLDTESKVKQGELGFVRKEELPKEIAENVFKTEPGKIVSEPMKIGNFYSVIKVGEKRPVQPPKFEQVKGEIYKSVSPEYAVKVIEKLRKESGVKKFDLEGKPLVEKTEQQKAEAAATPPVDLQKLDDNQVVAEFLNGEKIKISDLKLALLSLPEQVRAAPLDKIFEPLLNRVIDTKLISEASRKHGFDKDPAVLKKINEVFEMIVQRAFLEQEAGKLVTPEMVKEKYQQLLKLLPKNEMEVRLRHILVKTEEEALKLLKSLKSGAAFEDLVKEHSLDEKSKGNGGDIGYMRLKDLPKTLADAATKTSKATLINEPIKLDQGYLVVRVEDKRPIPTPTLEESKREITGMLTAEQGRKVLEGLKKQMTITKFDLNGQPLVATNSANQSSPASTVSAGEATQAVTGATATETAPSK